MATNGSVTHSYSYDGNGNRLSVVSSAGTLSGTYDAQDRLLTYGTTSFTYGDNGELESKTDSATQQTTLYTYDARGSLRSVSLPSGDNIDYVIDGYARRVGKKLNGSLNQGFLYKDALRITASLDASGNIAAQFTYLGQSHAPDTMAAGGVLYRFVKDQVGSVRLVVNASTGTIAQELDYDEFGRVLIDTNPGFQPFGFASGLYDSATGLVRFGALDYDAIVGRWTSKDPIRWRAGQADLYVYANDDPVNGLDPTGLSKFDKWHGLSKKFWKWAHRNNMDPNDVDFTKEEAEKAYEEWERLGKPGPDNKRGGNRMKDVDLDDILEDLSDILEMLLPVPWPDFPDPCVVTP